jgi:flagellar hook protein FlgE
MALIRSLGSAVSGMLSQQTSLNVISNNIANVNTTGFKRGVTHFKDVCVQTISSAQGPSARQGGVNPKQVGGGVAVAQIETVFDQGDCQTDGVRSHAAIDGNGFFLVKQPGCPTEYTRDGSFTVDARNQLVNSNGAKVQGWKADANGVVNTGLTPTDVVIPLGQRSEAVATTVINYGGNLDSSAAGPPVPPAVTPPAGTYATQVQVIDSLGTLHTMDLAWTKTGTNNWSWSATFPNDPTVTAVTQSASTVAFNANGQAISPNDRPNVTINLNNGAGPSQTFTLDLTGISQLDATNTGVPSTETHTLQALSQDGFTEGILQNFSFDNAGNIVGEYSNGRVANVGQLALGLFTNPGGLTKVGGNNYRESVNSGLPQVKTAPDCGTNVIGGSLEGSNVDVTTEFTKMIVTQRAFQANSRVITVSDEVINESLSILRR